MFQKKSVAQTCHIRSIRTYDTLGCSTAPWGNGLARGWSVSTGALGSQHWGPGQKARQGLQCGQDPSVGKNPGFQDQYWPPGNSILLMPPT